jgi:hypothetical protein
MQQLVHDRYTLGSRYTNVESRMEQLVHDPPNVRVSTKHYKQ